MADSILVKDGIIQQVGSQADVLDNTDEIYRDHQSSGSDDAFLS